MREMLLFGAGASIDAGVPGAFEMTKRILQNVRANNLFEKEAHVLSYVVGGLLQQEGRRNNNPLEPVINVEDLFNAVQMLAERDALEAAPFIGSWDSFIEELDKIHPAQPSGDLQRFIYNTVAKEIISAFSKRPSAFQARKRIDATVAATVKKAVEAAVTKRSLPSNSSSDISSAIESYIKEFTDAWSDKLRNPSLPASNNVDSQIKRRIIASQTRSGRGRVFTKTNALMIAALKDLVWLEDYSKVTYLAPILKLLQSQKSLTVVTLNYDNSVELLAASQSIACNVPLSQETFDSLSLSPDGINLLKLHGSIDWTWEVNQDDRPQYMPVAKVRHVSDDIKNANQQPAVIFGSRNKLTAKGPFLALLHEFQNQLALHDLLTIVGYSFRDSHINEYISHWLNGDSKRILRVVNGPNFSPRSYYKSGDIAPYARDLLEFQMSNPDRIIIVSDYARAGLERVYGTYELAESPLPPTESRELTALERLAFKDASAFFEDEDSRASSDEANKPTLGNLSGFFTDS